MAAFREVIESGGAPVPGASVTVFTESASVAVGTETTGAFSAATIYTDRAMSVAAANPLTTNSLGQIEFYMASGSQVALYVSKAGYGTVWRRFVDITGSDPA